MLLVLGSQSALEHVQEGGHGPPTCSRSVRIARTGLWRASAGSPARQHRNSEAAAGARTLARSLECWALAGVARLGRSPRGVSASSNGPSWRKGKLFLDSRASGWLQGNVARTHVSVIHSPGRLSVPLATETASTVEEVSL